MTCPIRMPADSPMLYEDLVWGIENSSALADSRKAVLLKQLAKTGLTSQMRYELAKVFAEDADTRTVAKQSNDALLQEDEIPLDEDDVSVGNEVVEEAVALQDRVATEWMNQGQGIVRETQAAEENAARSGDQQKYDDIKGAL